VADRVDHDDSLIRVDDQVASDVAQSVASITWCHLFLPDEILEVYVKHRQQVICRQGVGLAFSDEDQVLQFSKCLN